MLPSTARRVDGSPPARTSRLVARALLFGLVLSVATSPRFRYDELVSARALDLRAQDLLLAVALGRVALRRQPRLLRRMTTVWGPWFAPYAAGAVVVTLVHLVVSDVPALRRLAYVGRPLEIFFLAAVVASLVVEIGPPARRTFLRAAHVGIAVNAAWVGYQVLTDTSRTLFGSDVGAVAYGPRLVGEPSAFGTGVFFAFATVLGVAELRARTTCRVVATTIVSVGVAGAYLSGSRVSLGLALAACAFSVLWARGSAGVRAARAGAGVLIVVLALQVVPLESEGRLSSSGVESSLELRYESIWAPITDVSLDRSLIGIGPGALGTAEYPWPEAHNFILRAVLDFGVPVALLFVALLLHLLVRAHRIADAPPRRGFDHAIATTVLVFGSGLGLAGLVQDTYTAVMSTHLFMICVGAMAGDVQLQRRAHDRAEKEADRGTSVGPRGQP